MMEITRDNLLALIREGLKREELGVTGLERKANVPRDTVRDFIRAKTQMMRADKLQKIMSVLEPEHKIPITGYVGDGAEILAFPRNAEKDVVECPSGIKPSEVNAVRVKGDGAAPLFHAGWVIYYSRQHAAVPVIRGGLQVPYNKMTGKAGRKTGKKQSGEGDVFHEFMGRPCVVKLADGRTMLRVPKPGTQAGRYHLVSYSDSDIKNAEIEWMAKILFIKTV